MKNNLLRKSKHTPFFIFFEPNKLNLVNKFEYQYLCFTSKYFLNHSIKIKFSNLCVYDLIC